MPLEIVGYDNQPLFLWIALPFWLLFEPSLSQTHILNFKDQPSLMLIIVMRDERHPEGLDWLLDS